MKIRNVDIIRVKALRTVAENMDKKDYINYLKGYEDALKDYLEKENEECFKKLCRKVKGK